MLSREKILLVHPHPKEPLRSIFLYHDVLLTGLTARGVQCKTIGPPDFFARLVRDNSGWRRFLVYLDKQLLFPPRLRKEVRKNKKRQYITLVHILDQGDAVYTKYLKDTPHVVTCHDAFGMRSALGLEPLNRRRGLLSRLYQSAILSGLKHAFRVVCVSGNTQAQITELGVSHVNCTVICNGLNYPYQPMTEKRADMVLSKLFSARGIPTLSSGYILHLGGNSWYKNRKGVILAYAHLVKIYRDAPALILAGRPLGRELATLVKERVIKNHVFQCPDCSSEELNALYQGAIFLFYPSVREGFGWPVLEAQASSGLVVTSDREPMNVVGGNSAVYCEAPPEDGHRSDQWACRIAEKTLIPVLQMNNEERKSHIKRGLENATRYSPGAMVSSYHDFYQRCIEEYLTSNSRSTG